jgi:hypothetical protein
MQAGRTAGRSVAVLPLVAAQQTCHEHPPTKCNDQEHETEELQLGENQVISGAAITGPMSIPGQCLARQVWHVSSGAWFQILAFLSTFWEILHIWPSKNQHNSFALSIFSRNWGIFHTEFVSIKPKSSFPGQCLPMPACALTALPPVLLSCLALSEMADTTYGVTR